MNYLELKALFASKGIEDPETEARELLAFFLQRSPSFVLTHPDAECSDPRLSVAIEQRLNHRPLQYILGEWPFWNEMYEVQEGCLIPRPDTETLIEEAIRLLPPHAHFLDLCTGSGCVAISVLASRPDATAVAMDVDPLLVELATRNAKRNHVENRFQAIRCDVLSTQLDEWIKSLTQLPNAILSNPPYIPQSVIPSLSLEVQQEPRLALDGGGDGLLFYQSFLERAKKWVQPNGFCLFEIGFDQGEALIQLSKACNASCQILKDLGGNDRVAIINWEK